MIIICKNQADLQKGLTLTDNWCEEYGMEVNTSKCANLGIRDGAQYSLSITSHGQNIPSLGVKDFYDYLGLRIAIDTRIADSKFKSTLDSCSEDIALIGNSVLAPHNKISMIKSFVLSKLNHVMRLKDINKTDLTNFSKDLRGHIRELLDL
ncbi:hypothetical protein RF11_01120 [Thelohanellus kitauei]|uniref:Reverse transcriptase domain-containing protein n=1 Tax=Thelohanellus kitauei TaxID=669202 RepID=A0A0C2NE40_THEKT|nr:hypothetical protein RF11_01120 [Thelohanellus kitauei]